MKQRKRSWQYVGVGLCICMLLGMLSGCGSSRSTKETEETTYGIDVAKYQGTIDWQTLGQGSVDFAMVRVGYRTLSDGVIEEDSNGRYNLQEASKAGIPLGVYFFSTAVSEEEAEEEARWVADFIANYPVTYPVVYDCEGFRDPESRQYGMTVEARTNAALAFLKTIEELGYEGMFYGAKNELEAFWEMERIDQNYKVWVAQYPAEPYPDTPQSSYEGSHHMWQYTAEGTIAGIDTNVDLNVAYFGYDGIEPAKDPQILEEVGPDPEALMEFSPVSEQVTAKVETNLRDIPSQDSDSEILRVLHNGEVAERIAVSESGWSKLSYQGAVYYAVSNYLTTDLSYDPDAAAADPDGDGIETQFNETSQLVTAKEVVNLRKLPSATREDATVLFQLKNGNAAVCTGVSDNGWSRLQYNGETCYAISSYLMPYTGASDSAGAEDVGMEFTDVQDRVTPTKAVNLRTEPNTDSDGNVVVKVQNGEILYRIGVNKEMGWSKVIYYGQTLYCASMLLTVVEG